MRKIRCRSEALILRSLFMGCSWFVSFWRWSWRLWNSAGSVLGGASVCVLAWRRAHPCYLGSWAFCFWKGRDRFSSWPLRKRRSAEAETAGIWNEIKGCVLSLPSARRGPLACPQVSPALPALCGRRSRRLPWPGSSRAAKPLLCPRCLSPSHSLDEAPQPVCPPSEPCLTSGWWLTPGAVLVWAVNRPRAATW